ncbi:MAG: hypothetical protein HY350_02160 [Candidatus Omnitrophica bacterium]|nr:hypothetical protein [Candidatus Omnitrophota bacterium]
MKTMSSPERVFAVLKGAIPDRVPIVEMLVDPKVIHALYPNLSYYDFIEQSGYYDAVSSLAGIVSTGIDWVDQSRKVFRDKWGAIQQFTEESIPFAIPPARIQCESDFFAYTPPDPGDPCIISAVQDMVGRFKGKKALILVGEDVFAPSQYLRGGLENLLVDYKLNPSFAKKIMKMVEEYQVELYRRVIKEGIEIIILGDDYAGKNGTFMSPSDFEHFILPGLHTVVREIKNAGGYCIKHTDGNIWNILDMIVETGVDALGPLQATAGMNLALIKKRYSNVCVMGSMDVDLLIRGSTDEVRKATMVCLAEVSPGGRHILSSANTITSATQPENLKIMIETAHRWGGYPIGLK